jgi:hypothetical protein
LSAILGSLGRFAVIVLGYAAAALVASLFLNLMLVGSLDDATELFHGPYVLVVAFFTVFIGYFAFFPALLVIAAAEMLGRRDWLFYALAGAAVSVAATGLYVGTSGWQSGGSDQPDFALALIASGVAAGLTYWAIAGRRAGFRRDP